MITRFHYHEAKGSIEFDAMLVRFTHAILASSNYSRNIKNTMECLVELDRSTNS